MELLLRDTKQVRQSTSAACQRWRTTPGRSEAEPDGILEQGEAQVGLRFFRRPFPHPRNEVLGVETAGIGDRVTECPARLDMALHLRRQDLQFADLALVDHPVVLVGEPDERLQVAALHSLRQL